MLENFRHFKAGPDLSGRVWQVDLLWIQNAIAIRHSDSVDVKFLLTCGEEILERVVSLRHKDLLELSSRSGRPLTDAWCMSLAARHLRRMVETGEDFEKSLVTVSPAELEEYATESSRRP